jgi:pimeloyl-ACP methyl ester carboxylesterase
MASHVVVSDPPAGAGATGQIRHDRRAPQTREHANPLVLVGGMTQTVSSWGGHLRPLARRREVVAYEARGQGMTELSLDDCSFSRHVEDFVALARALELETPVDLCGFSFGGRLCLAIAATRPELVRRLVLTGVALDRGIVGRLIVQGWRASLATGDLEALARVSLPDILGPAYLEKHAALVESMVKTSVQRNRYAGIVALFDQTLALPEGSPWSLPELIGRVRAPTLVIGGAHDRLAPPGEVEQLAARLGARHLTLPDAGHTVPIETPTAWRSAVEAFLDEP